MIIPLLASPFFKPIAAIVIVIGAMGFGFYRGADYGKSREVEKRIKLETEIAEDKAKAEFEFNASLNREIERNNILSRQLATALAKKEKVRVEVRTRVQKEIVEKPVYLECVVPPSGVLILNEITERYNTERQESSTK